MFIDDCSVDTIRNMPTSVRQLLDWPSWAQYVFWRATNSRRPLWCSLSNGTTIAVRPRPSSDLDTANEVFAQRAYDPTTRVDPEHVLRVADLGANVGYSLLWWLRLFPAAHVTAYEPHPLHCRQIRAHMTANRVTKRVTLHEAAAGISVGNVYLSDNENQSSVVGISSGIEVPVRDVYSDFVQTRPDLLKIDIEGAEYEILGDPRFATLRTPTVVLEWHKTADPRSGQAWVTDRLVSLGYEVIQGADFETFGIIWGFARE